MSASEDQARDVDFSVLVDIHIGADDTNNIEHGQHTYTYTKTSLYTSNGRTSAVELRGTNPKHSVVIGYASDRSTIAAWLTESGTQIHQMQRTLRSCWSVGALARAVPDLLRSYLTEDVVAFLNTTTERPC